jgi:hypothetical protein
VRGIRFIFAIVTVGMSCRLRRPASAGVTPTSPAAPGQSLPQLDSVAGDRLDRRHGAAPPEPPHERAHRQSDDRRAAAQARRRERIEVAARDAR